MTGGAKTAKAAKGEAKAPPALSFAPRTETVEVGGQQFTVSALPCGVMRRVVLPLAARAGGADPLPMLAEVLDVCLLSLTKAQPGLTADALEDCLTLDDAADLFQHVLRVSTGPRLAAPVELPPAFGADKDQVAQGEPQQSKKKRPHNAS